jgi:hypothetical protein
MSREALVILLGFILILWPSIGIPTQWKTYGLIGVGILLVLIGYSLRHSRYLRAIDRGNGERGTDSFVESRGQRASDLAGEE